MQIIFFCTLLGISLLLGLAWYFSQHIQKGTKILCFQKIGTPFKKSTLKSEWISPRTLEKKIQRLIKRNYTFLRPDQLSSPHPQKSVLLVFRGGYRSFYTAAFPLLQKYNIPAMIFLTPDLIGQYNAWQDSHQEPWQDLITKDELDTLKNSPLISFGALPLGGQNITACPPEQAVFLLQESIYRLKHQWGIAPLFWSNYSKREIPGTLISNLKQQGISLSFLDEQFVSR